MFEDLSQSGAVGIKGEEKGMSDQPKISVIVPFYNAERYLKQCLDSLQKQTYSNFEALLINDGSIDQSYQIAAEYAKVDERFNCDYTN